MTSTPTPHAGQSAHGRITESRTDPNWGRSPTNVKNGDWFAGRQYTTARLSLGHQTDREFYVYDATALVVKGHCDWELISEALAEEELTPIRTADGRAFASIWINTLRDSVCGSYHEIVVSIDATQTGETFDSNVSSTGNPFRHLYNNFGDTVCKCQFMHSLYINSPVSIAWGREMQAFPKHPEPIDSKIEDDHKCLRLDIRWQNEPVMAAIVQKPRWLGRFIRQTTGLVSAVSPLRLLGFLSSQQLDVPLQMPKATAAPHGLPTKYLAQLRKGLNPDSLQCWPWSKSNSLELGSVVKDTGHESNNGHDLIRRAGFTPTIVTYFPFMQGYIHEL